MKSNLPVTGRETVYPDDAIILSTTDSKGIITYANDDFIKVSGFETDELIGKNHNLVRHPDMPPAAFADLWQTLQQGKPWMGIVKNRCKNGDHYWVDAFVTPIYDNGKVVEYQSVRSKPRREQVARAEQVYQNINQSKPPFKQHNVSLNKRLTLNAMIALLPMLIVGVSIESSWTLLLPIMLISLMALMGLNHLALRPQQQLEQLAKQVVDNKLMQYIYTGRTDLIGEIALALKMQQSELGAMTGRMSDTIGQISTTVETTAATLNQTKSQSSELNYLSEAMEEMARSMNEVTDSVNQASNSSDACRNSAERGRNVVTHVVASIGGLADDVEHAAKVVGELAQASETIGGVLEVISGIAEQTNLLALNAAIEAARAGDQGRGFAVVADEVRSLATRTRESTQDITTMIDQLQSRAEQAMNAMKNGGVAAENSVVQVEEAKHVLETIISSISQVNEMNTNIASAVNQQQGAVDEINANLTSLNTMAEETACCAEHTGQMIHELIEETDMCTRLIKQFRSAHH